MHEGKYAKIFAVFYEDRAIMGKAFFVVCFYQVPALFYAFYCINIYFVRL